VSRLLVLAALLIGCVGNGLPQAVEPTGEGVDSPCFKANLLDGLSETDSGELRALWRCLNLNGGFSELEPIVLAMEVGTVRGGGAAEFELARTINGIAPSADLVGWLKQAAHLLKEEDVFLLHVVHTIAEWAYGDPWGQVELQWAAGGGQYGEPGATDAGLVAPLFPLFGTLGAAVLDTDQVPEIASALEDMASMPQLAEVLDTVARMVDGPEVVLFQNMPVASAGYLEASPGPGGRNTLLDAVEAITTPADGLLGETVLVAALPPVDRIIDDVDARDRLIDALGSLYVDGALDELPGQLHRLTTQDAHGSGLEEGERTALEALIALLEAADQEVNCVLLTVDNLSVFLLETVARWDPDNVAFLIEASEDLVQLVIDLGGPICSGIDPQLGDFAPSLVRLAESGALDALIPILGALDESGRVPEIVEILSAIERGDATASIALHGRQVFDGPFLGNLLEILGAFVDPQDPVSRGDIHSLLEVVDRIVSPPIAGGYGDTPLGLMDAPLRATVAAHHDLLNDFLLQWAVLLRTEGSESNEFFEHIAPLLAIDPELDFLQTVGTLVGQAETLESLMLLAECDEVRAALAAGAGRRPGESGLLGLLARMASDGSLEAALVLLSWTAEALDAIGLLNEETP
jgi:hypothetical protein